MAVTDYLKGDGSVNNPYIIHSLAAAVQWFGTDIFSNPSKYAELIIDVDLTGNSFNVGNVTTYGVLQGNGHTINNLSHFSGNVHNSIFYRCNFINIFALHNIPFQSGSASRFIDCKFTGGTLGIYYGSLLFTRCIFTKVGWKYTYTNSATITDSFILPPSGYTVPGKFTDLSASATAYAASNFANFAPTNWTIDGASEPRLIVQNTAHLTNAYVIKGVTKVGGTSRSRTVSCHSPADLNQITKGKSLGDGSYILNCGLYTDHVVVMHSDDYGKLFAANFAYALGDVIHPSTPNGYRYICTTAGTSAATGPSNWPTVGTITSGSAIFTAQPVYKPEAFIAVPVLVNLLTGLPV